MKLSEIAMVKKDSRGIIYDCDRLYWIERKKGTISADHTHTIREVLYLMRGKVRLTLGRKTKTVKSPLKITIPRRTYHKLVALTDIVLLEDRKL